MNCRIRCSEVREQVSALTDCHFFGDCDRDNPRTCAFCHPCEREARAD
jgi:hypothetical protein